MEWSALFGDVKLYIGELTFFFNNSEWPETGKGCGSDTNDTSRDLVTRNKLPGSGEEGVRV